METEAARGAHRFADGAAPSRLTATPPNKELLLSEGAQNAARYAGPGGSGDGSAEW